MQQAFQAARAGQQGPNLPTLDFSLKPGETVSLKLADKVIGMLYPSSQASHADTTACRWSWSTKMKSLQTCRTSAVRCLRRHPASSYVLPTTGSRHIWTIRTERASVSMCRHLCPGAPS